MGIKDILEILQNHVKLTSGLLMLMVTSGALFAINQGYVEEKDVPITARFFLVLFLLFGASIVLLVAGSKAEQRIRLAKDHKREKAASAAAKARDDEESISNLDTLDEQELLTFVWLLRNGQKRFGKYSHSIRRLSGKRIIRDVGPHGIAVYQFVDVIWDKRNELLLQHIGIRFIRDEWPIDRVFYQETRRR